MALIQRYSTELSTHATTNHRIHEETQAVEHVLNDVAAIKRQDEDEKRYFHSLNDRLEELVRSLDDLEVSNKKLRDDLTALISNWGIGGDSRAQFLRELDGIIHRLSEQNHQKSLFQAESKIFDEITQVTERVSVVFVDVVHLYRDKCQIIFELTNELEEELRKIRLRLDMSNAQVKSHDDDYQKELQKFRSYLAEWSQLALDKQHILNEIQSLKERYNLRLAYNQEEIKEWQRLLNRISQESRNYYRDYLDTIKQQIQMDYEQMAKEQQLEVETQLKSRLKEIQEKIDQGLPLDENDERRRREETQHFESRLDQSTQDYDRLQNDYRILAEEIQHKRRGLQDLQNELRNKARKHAEQHARLQHDTDLTRAEYYSLRDELDKFAYKLRFSVEEELKIYEALLNSFQRKKDERLPIDDSRYRQSTTTTTQRFIDNTSSERDSTEYRRTQPSVTETTRTFTKQTNVDDSIKYRPPSPPLLTESTTKRYIENISSGGESMGFQRTEPSATETTRIFTTQTNVDDSMKYRPPSPPLLTETTTKRYIETISSGGDSTEFRRREPSATETTRVFTSQTNINDSMKYRSPSPPLLTETTTTTKRYIENTSSGGDSMGFRRREPSATETTRIFTSQTNVDDSIKYRPPSPPFLTETTTKRYIETINSGADSMEFRRREPSATETTRIFTSQTNINDSIKYRPPSPPFLTETTTKRYIETINSGADSMGFRRREPSATETTRIFTSQTNINDSIKYRPPSPPFLTETTTKRYIENINSGGNSMGFRQREPSATETTRIFTTETNVDDSMKYRPPPPPPPLPLPLPPPPPPSVLSETTTTTSTKTIKQQSDHTPPVIRIEQAEKPTNQWTHENITSGTTSSTTREESTDRDRSAERTVVPSRPEVDQQGGGMQQSLVDQNRTTTTTTRTTRRFGRGGSAGSEQQQTGSSTSKRDQSGTSTSRRDQSGVSASRGDQSGIGTSKRDQSGISTSRRNQTVITSNVPEVDEKLLQSKIHITRKYKGNILIKFVDVSGRFVEIENTGNQTRDLTGWYIERSVDGRRVDFTFPVYELPPHTTVRIYGNYHQRSSSSGNDQHLQLIAPNFYDWGNGRQMRTELFNRDDVGKALFEQTIRD